MYYQVQLWLGRKPDPDEEKDDRYFVPTNWGWMFVNNVFKPIFVDGKLLPDELLRTIRCNCKMGCKSNCGCKKHGLKCSDYCGHCRGLTCNNKQEVTDVTEEEEDIDNEETNELPKDNELIDESEEDGIAYDVPTNEEIINSDESSDSEIEESEVTEGPPTKKAKLAK